MPINETVIAPDTINRARRRIFWRTIPFLFCLYIVAFLDRVNVGFAAPEMSKALGFTPKEYGFGAGIFFIGYFLLEIPGSVIAEKWSARRWIARIMISWGVLSIFTGFIENATQFYWIRFLLGAAEAGFFPGIIVYLSHWFRPEDRAKAVALFMSALPVTSILGSPLSSWILGVNWLGLSGWRWVFILEGAPAILFGIATIFYLTDWPHQAKWLPEDERAWITRELEREKQTKKAARSHATLDAFRHREVILLTLTYFFAVTGVYGFNFWLPTIMDRSGLPKFTVALLTALPYCVALVTMLALGWSSDRTKERRWHTALPLVIVSLGLLLSVVARHYLGVTIAMFCLVGVGLYSYLPSFWGLATSFLAESAGAVAIGLVNSFGNLGGFVGPYIVAYAGNEPDSAIGGMAFLSVSALIAALLVLSLRKPKPLAVPVSSEA
jgi:ACS family tartrate transporter-like MFS transporter